MPRPERLDWPGAAAVAVSVSVKSPAGVNPVEKNVLLAMSAVDEEGLPSVTATADVRET